MEQIDITLDDIHMLMKLNSEAGLQLQNIALTRILEAKDGELEKLKAKSAASNGVGTEMEILNAKSR